MNRHLPLIVMIVAIAAAGCQSPTPEPTATPAPTNTSPPTSTVTPIPPTDTPIPTATATFTSTPKPTSTPTLTPTATTPPTNTPQPRPTLAPTQSGGGGGPATTAPTQPPAGGGQVSDESFKSTLIALQQVIKGIGGLNDDPSGAVSCGGFVNTYSALFGFPTYDGVQLGPNGQAALGSYQAALAKVIDTSRDEYLFCFSVVQGTPTSPFIPAQHWELSRMGVNQALELLKPALALFGISS